MFTEQFDWSILTEVLRGCREYDFPGSKFCEFTPVDPALSIELEEMLAEDRLPEGWQVFRANTECAMEAGHVSETWFREFFGMVSEEMRETRMTGQFASYEGTIYQSFNPAIHFCPEDAAFPDGDFPICGGMFVVAVVVVATVVMRNAPDGAPARAVFDAANEQLQEDADRRAVRAWLEENTNTGEWEEVRWWPSLSLDEYVADRIALSEEVIAECNGQIQRIQQGAQGIGSVWDWEFERGQAEFVIERIRQHPPASATRLTFRSKNEFGAMVVMDATFVRFQDGTLTLLEDAELYGVDDYLGPLEVEPVPDPQGQVFLDMLESVDE